MNVEFCYVKLHALLHWNNDTLQCDTINLSRDNFETHEIKISRELHRTIRVVAELIDKAPQSRSSDSHFTFDIKTLTAIFTTTRLLFV